MSAFSTIAAQWTVNVSDITSALKAGTIDAHEAAVLLERVKLVSVVGDRQKQLTATNYVGNEVTDEAWLEPIPENSYEGMKSLLSEPEHIEKYYDVMTLRGFS